MLASSLRASSGLKAGASRPCRGMLRCRALLAPAQTSTALSTGSSRELATQQDTYVDARAWTPVNLTKATLVELQGIPLQASSAEPLSSRWPA
jgi:hypothetical protein